MTLHGTRDGAPAMVVAALLTLATARAEVFPHQLPDCAAFTEPLADLIASVFGERSGVPCADLDGDGRNGATGPAVRVDGTASRHR